jgi:hypothetical protein
MLWLGVAVFGLLTLLATQVARRIWRGERGEWSKKPPWWQRGVPTLVVIAWAMLVGAAVTPIATEHGGTLGAISTVILLFALILVVAGAVLWPVVAFGGQPQLFVPPGLRRDVCIARPNPNRTRADSRLKRRRRRRQ